MQIFFETRVHSRYEILFKFESWSSSPG